MCKNCCVGCAQAKILCFSRTLRASVPPATNVSGGDTPRGNVARKGFSSGRVRALEGRWRWRGKPSIDASLHRTPLTAQGPHAVPPPPAPTNHALVGRPVNGSGGGDGGSSAIIIILIIQQYCVYTYTCYGQSTKFEWKFQVLWWNNDRLQ